jgi:hypothetical protein
MMVAVAIAAVAVTVVATAATVAAMIIATKAVEKAACVVVAVKVGQKRPASCF